MWAEIRDNEDCDKLQIDLDEVSKWSKASKVQCTKMQTDALWPQESTSGILHQT